MHQAWTPNSSWVTDDLAVGGSFPAGYGATLAAQHGIGAVIDARAEACDDEAELTGCGVRFLHLPTLDLHAHGQEMLDAGVAFAADARAQGRRLLIHCEHGIGRSATLALCVLVDRGWEPLAALGQAKDVRWLVSPSPAQYEAWMTWIERKHPGVARPHFDAFKAIAYRHLAAQA